MSDLSPIPLHKVKKQFQAYLDSPTNTTDINTNENTINNINNNNNSLNNSPLKPLTILSPVKYFSKNPSPVKEQDLADHFVTYNNKENMNTANMVAIGSKLFSPTSFNASDSAEKLSPIKLNSISNNSNHVDLNMEFDFLKNKGFSKKLTNSVISDLYQRVEKFSSNIQVENENIIDGDKKLEDFNKKKPELRANHESSNIHASQYIDASSSCDNNIKSKFDRIYNKNFQNMESIETHYVSERTKVLLNRDIKTPSSVIKSWASSSSAAKKYLVSPKRKISQQDIPALDINDKVTNDTKNTNNKRQSMVMSTDQDPDGTSLASSVTTTTKKRRTLVGSMPVMIPLNDIDNESSNNSNKQNLKHLDLTVDMSMLTRFDNQQLQSDIDLSSSADISMTNYNKEKDKENKLLLLNANILESLNTTNNNKVFNAVPSSENINRVPSSSGSASSASSSISINSGSKLIKSTKKSQISASMNRSTKIHSSLTNNSQSNSSNNGRVISVASYNDTTDSVFSNNDYSRSNYSNKLRNFSNATTASSISTSHINSHLSLSKDPSKNNDDIVFAKPLSRPLHRPNSDSLAARQFQGTQETLKSQMRKQNSTSNFNSTHTENNNKNTHSTTNEQKYSIKPLTPRSLAISNNDNKSSSNAKIPSFLQPTAASLSRQSSRSSISSASSSTSLSRGKYNNSKKIAQSSSTTSNISGSNATIRSSTSLHTPVLSTSGSLNSESERTKNGIHRTESGKIMSSISPRAGNTEKINNASVKGAISRRKWGLYGNYFQK